MSSPRPRPTPGRSTPDAAAAPVPPPETVGRPASGLYEASVVAPVQIAVGVAIAVVLAIVLIALGLWPLAIVGVLAVVGVSIYLGTVTLEVTPTRVSVGQGRGDRSPHTVETRELAGAAATDLSWPQCWGLGLGSADDTARYTVRPGPTLVLTLRTGEILRISAPDPKAAAAVLRL